MLEILGKRWVSILQEKEKLFFSVKVLLTATVYEQISYVPIPELGVKLSYANKYIHT